MMIFSKRKKPKFLLSILICTLEERLDMFEKLYNKLMLQKSNFDDIEILYSRDAGEMSVGDKRNKLLNKSKGVYACFIDDDDDVCDEYMTIVHDACEKNKDCVSLVGEIFFVQDGNKSKKFTHSIKYNSYTEDGNGYYRPPNHLNPIKTSISKQFKFPDANHGEDFEWSMEICRSGLVKTEVEIDKIYYYYLYVARKR